MPNVQTTGLAAAEDAAPLHRLGGLMRNYAAGLDGTAVGVRGYDRGNSATTFQGPVTLVPTAAAAVNGVSSPAGVYKPGGEFQDSLSNNPELDPYSRALWYRGRR